MSEQKYFLAGLDLSALTSTSQEQIMQAINGMEPLDNIGVLVVGTVRPDITNNPEMINSLWLDITTASNPVLKRYVASRTVLVDADLSWEAVAIADSSITTAMITARSSTGGVNIAKLKINADYSAGSAYFILRASSDGKYVEAVSLDTALSDGGGVAFNRISTTGIGTGKFLRAVAGALAYGYIDPANDINSTIGNRIPAPTCISPGTALYLLRTNSAGTAPEWIAATDATLLFNLTQLNSGGASTNDILRFDGTNWVKVTPSLRMVAGDAINSGVNSTSGDTNAGTVAATTGGNPAQHLIAHGLTTTPKLFRVVAICTSTDAGFAVNDEIDIMSIRASTGNHAVTIGANATNIFARFNAATNLEICQYNGGATVYTAMDETKWTVRAYAWK